MADLSRTQFQTTLRQFYKGHASNNNANLAKSIWDRWKEEFKRQGNLKHQSGQHAAPAVAAKASAAASAAAAAAASGGDGRSRPGATPIAAAVTVRVACCMCARVCFVRVCMFLCVCL